MTAAQFCLAAVRLLLVAFPVAFAAHRLRERWVSLPGAAGVLSDLVVGMSLLLLIAEALGLFGLLHSAELIGVSLAVALATAWISVRPRIAPRPATLPAAPATLPAAPATLLAAAATVAVVGQWAVQTANALGSGMFNFDTLWYHMPFAAGFAQTGSVTGIHFTMADPITAYYPANSELVHAVGITLMHGDFLSPLINFGWLGVALLAAWCAGRRWALQRETLCAGALLLALPVLSGTQPGEAFNDAAGLAMLMAAAALLLGPPEEERGVLAVAGLALGWAAGVKYTFLVPALVLLVGLVAVAGGRRWRTLLALGLPLGVTCGLWYVRNLIDIGNPLGVRLHVGPVTLPGPVSPVSNSLQQTVVSQLGHTSLWISRFEPGLAHMLGVLWPLVLLAYLAGVLGGLGRRHPPVVRLLALAGALSGLAYLVFPTGATWLATQTGLFEVNLRYVTPALALGLLILPVLLGARRPRWLVPLDALLVLILLVSQLEPHTWPQGPARHAAFLFATAGLAAIVLALARSRARRALAASRLLALGAGAGALLLVGGIAYAAQRHYYARRYLAAPGLIPSLQALYRWGQSVSGARIALYGPITQYPLYGARDTNRVSYLGERVGDGGYRPIATCARWRATIDRGHYEYLVLGGAQTGAIPVQWTTEHTGAATVILHPDAGTWVFRLSGPLDPRSCPAG